MKNFDKIIPYLAICPFILIIIFAFISSILRKSKKTFISKISKILDSIVVSIIIIIFSGFSICIFVYMIALIYSIVNSILNKLNMNTILNVYLSLTTTLILSPYLPELLGYYFLLLLSKVTGKSQIHTLFKKIVKKVRLKLWIYFVAFILVIIQSIETFLGKEIILNNLWIQLKPAILQSVVSYLAFDRIENYLTKNYENLKKDIKKLGDYYKSIWGQRDA